MEAHPEEGKPERSSTDLRARVLSGFRWTAIVRFSAQLIGWSITVVVVRFIRPDEYGLKAMAEVAYAFLMMLSSAGINAAIIQARQLREEQSRQVFGVLLGVNTGLFALQIAAAPLLAMYYQEPRVALVIQVLAIGFLISPFISVPEALLTRDLEFKKRSLAELTGSTVGGVATLTLAVLGAGVWALVIGQLSTLLLKAVGLGIAARWWKLPIFRLRGMGELLNFGGLVMLTGVVWIFYSRIDVVIAGRLLGTHLVGLYALAMHLATLPMERIMPLIHQIAFPAYSRLQDRPEEVSRYFLKSVRLVSTSIFPMFLGLAGVAPLFVPLVLGESWSEAVIPLVVLSFVTPIRAIGTLFSPMVNALGRPGVQLGNAIITLLLLGPAILVGTRWGLVGISVAWLVAYPVAFVVCATRSLRVIKVGLREYLVSLRGGSVAAVAMYVCVVLLRRTVLDAVNPWVALAAEVLVGVMVYCGVLWFGFRSEARELQDTIILLRRG